MIQEKYPEIDCMDGSIHSNLFQCANFIECVTRVSLFLKNTILDSHKFITAKTTKEQAFS